MSKNKEINPIKLILCLWRERVLITFLSILCTSLFFLYSINLKEDFQTKIVIANPPSQIFEPYNSAFYRVQNEIFRQNQNNNNIQQIGKSYLQNQFVISFHQNIKSIYNFRDFLDNNNKYEKFYKSKNIKIEKYFNKSNFGSIKQREKNNLNNFYEYYFIFPEDFPGDIFFSDYILFSYNKTAVEFEKEIKETIQNLISYDMQILNVIKKIDYNSITNFKNNNNLNEHLIIQKVNDLSVQIEQNQLIIQNLNHKKFNFDLFLDKLSKPTPVSKYSVFLYSLLGLSLGFFLALIIIFFKNFKTIIL
jgi:LPS O-antigen subunit length determinant protein (WzzB/FepE family)